MLRRLVALLLCTVTFRAAPGLSARGLGSAQTSGAKGVQKKSSHPPIGFVCPDPQAARACKSFAELRQAGDDGVRASVARDGIAYACFRQPDDSFFVLDLDGPV